MTFHTAKTTRRKFLSQTSALLTGCTLSAAFPPLSWAKKASAIKVAVLSPSHCALPMIYAQQAGFYQEYGLQVEIYNASSMAEIAWAIFQEKIQFGQLMVPLTIAAHMGLGSFHKREGSLVSPMWAGTNGGAMVVRSDSDIMVPGDLKGKTIGIHSRYLFHYLITMELLERYQLEASTDVGIKIIHMKNMVNALKNGEIDAFVNAEPLSSAAVAKGIARDFLLSKDLWFRHPCCCLTARRSLFEQHQSLFHDFTMATMRGALALNSTGSRNEKLKHIWENTPQYQELPLPVLQKAFTPGRTDFDPFPYQSSLKVVGKMLKHNGLMPRDLAYDAICNEVFLSDYARSIMEKLNVNDIPSSNHRPESVIGKTYS